MTFEDFKSKDEVAWCPGCGNFGIQTALKKALVKLGRPPKDILLVSGIGQAAKLPHYIRSNCFNGLHGRALPAAVGAKIANRDLTVIVTTGDGDCFGEGGNHFLHNIRRNADITVIVHDNQVYGLTKGQASPTTEQGRLTKTQTRGALSEPLHPLEMAIALGCGFVARGYSADSDFLAELIGQGIAHKGFSFIDCLQPCVSFNKVNTYEWYSKRLYPLDASHDPGNKALAFVKAAEWGERIPLGVFYKNERPSYEELSGIDAGTPLVEADLRAINVREFFPDFQR